MHFLLRISYIFLWALFLEVVLPSDGHAITIFVDGMNSDITTGDLAGGSYDRKGSYLMQSQLGKELKQKDKKQEIIEWNGDILKEYGNNSAANKLYERIKDIRSNPKTKDEPINIVSHSYGTVIAYNALERLNNDPKTKNYKIDSLTTMGSPLGKQDGLEIGERINNIYNPSMGSGIKEEIASDLKKIALKDPKQLDNVRQWTNLWADNDNISGKINIKGVKNIQVDADVKNHGKWWSQKVEGTIQGEYGEKVKVSNLKTIDIWHRAYYTPIENLTIASTGEKINWNIPKDYANALMSGKIESFKGVISLQENGKGESPGQQVSGHKEGDKVNLAKYESMSKKDLRKEMEQKFGPNDKYDKMSKRELISALTGISKEQIHTSDKSKAPGKDLDDYEKMSKGDLRKEMEKKFGRSDKYDKMSQREMISALTGVPKDQVHASKEKDKHDSSKDLDHYGKMSKKELRKELERKQGHKDNYDKMSKRELISALTGIPKDKIDLDKKEKNQAKAKDDDRHKKDTGSISKLSKQQVEDIWKARPDVQQNVHAKKGGDPYEKTQKWWDKYGQKEMKDFFTTASAPISPQSSSPSKNPVAKLTRAQAEEIWKARPDVEQNVHAKKKGDPYEKTQTWWEKYGQKEMSSYQFAGTTPTTPTTPPTPIASSPAPSPSPTALKPIKKLSKAQVEEIWKARPDVNENVHAKKKGDPYEKTQTWWEKTGQKEMGNYQFAGTSATPATSPPAAPAVTPPTAPSSKAPDAKVSTEIDEKRRKQEKSRAEQERQKQAKLEELRRRDEAKRLQEARKREEQTKTEEKLKATQEERKRQETQRRAEQERQRQAMADEQRRREEQQRQAQMEQQRRAEEQRRRVEQEHQRAQQEQIRRQQEQQQRARMEQQSRIQAEQQLRLQQEEARRRQTQMQQQRIHQSQPPPPSKQQQQQQKQKPTGQQ